MNYMEPNMEIIWLNMKEESIRTLGFSGDDVDEGGFEEWEEV